MLGQEMDSEILCKYSTNTTNTALVSSERIFEKQINIFFTYLLFPINFCCYSTFESIV